MGKVLINMKNVKTVTVGIPAHNEQNTIAEVLKGVLSQIGNGFVLEKVFVLCDGCTDNTSSIVKEYANLHKLIELREDGKRMGKSERLNQLYSLSNSDICITFDADVKFGGKNVIEEMVKRFEDEKIGLVGGANLPLPPRTFFEKIVVAWLEVWYEVRKNFRNGSSVHNHLGCITAMSKSLYKKTLIPRTIVADDDYLYFNATQLKYEFAYASKAKIYFRTVSNLHDFFNQHSRFLTLKNSIRAHFGEWVIQYYKIPFKLKVKCLIKTFFKNPFYLSLSIIFQFALIGYTKFIKPNYGNGMWRVASSSKII